MKNLRIANTPPEFEEEKKRIEKHMFEETTDEEFEANDGYPVDKFVEKYGSVKYKAYYNRIQKLIEDAEKQGILL